MKLYVTDDGQWHTSAGSAGSGARMVDVPWDKKESLAAWLSEQSVMKLETPGEPQHWELRKRDRAAEIEKALGVEEEIQTCDLPRLAVLAANVAYRFGELARKGEGR